MKVVGGEEINCDKERVLVECCSQKAELIGLETSQLILGVDVLSGRHIIEEFAGVFVKNKTVKFFCGKAMATTDADNLNPEIKKSSQNDHTNMVDKSKILIDNNFDN